MTFLIKPFFLGLLLGLSLVLHYFSGSETTLPDAVPEPVCIPGLAVELMPVIPQADIDGDGDLDAGSAWIAAVDLIDSLILNGDPGPLTYSANILGEVVDPQADTLLIPCDSDATLLAEVWVWDAEGNGASCETYILVQNNMVYDCGHASTSIAGVIATEELNTVSGVEILIGGNTVAIQTTGPDGHYILSGLEPGFGYTITPSRNDDPLNGLSNFDLVLISKHVLGIQLLDSPYKMIAADIDQSQNISVADVIELRRLLLNINAHFTNNTSWRFVDTAYQFPDTANPWTEPIPEIISINSLEPAIANLDFVAIKIGDVSLDAKAH
ncbi:MAG: hypothetical protein R2824_12875 [Saprospiraceae bacterium]|nr:hypothetical protein [Lewinella sp.]